MLSAAARIAKAIVAAESKHPYDDHAAYSKVRFVTD